MPQPTGNGGDAIAASQNQNPNLAKGPAGGKTPPQRDPVLSDRDRLLERMDEQIAEARVEDEESYLQSADPRALALKAEMEAESEGQATRGDRRQGRTAPVTPVRPTQDEDAAPVSRATEATQIQPDGQDPLEEYIVRQAGKPPMFKAIVNGETRLVPLEQARVQLQKHVAADIRMQRASERERALNQREQAIVVRERQPVQPVVQFDDASLETESRELVRSLVNEPEDKAALRMKATLQKIRASVPQIDPKALVREAVTTARAEIAAENHALALTTGLSQFESDYPDINGDPDLYNLADKKTETIAADHPTWTPAQVMNEAGKQVRDWVGRLSGKPYVPTARRENGQFAPANNRQAAKDRLVPMPQARSVRPAAEADPNADESPQSIMAEIRGSRGQSF